MNSFSQNMFEGELAKYYDLMHRHRNYTQESKFVDQLVQRFCPGAEKILDICCGTGEHIVRMAQRGYILTGIDSSQDMLKLAQEKVKGIGLSIDFRCLDIKELDFDKEFQVVYCLGYTFLYMTTYSDVQNFLSRVHRALLPGGILILDFLNGWKLIEEYPRDKFVYRDKQTTIFRFEQAFLNRMQRVKHIEFFYVIEDNSEGIRTSFAEENLRIFFEDEVMMLMDSNGFEGVESFGGYSMDSTVNDSSSVIVVVGRKKENE